MASGRYRASIAGGLHRRGLIVTGRYTVHWMLVRKMLPFILRCSLGRFAQIHKSPISAKQGPEKVARCQNSLQRM